MEYHGYINVTKNRRTVSKETIDKFQSQILYHPQEINSFLKNSYINTKYNRTGKFMKTQNKSFK